jgi:hypothetical protein
MNATTSEMVAFAVALLRWAQFGDVRVTPWPEDERIAHVHFGRSGYSLLMSGSDVATHTPGFCLCDGLDERGYANVIAVWNVGDNQIPVPLDMADPLRQSEAPHA